MPAQSKHNPFKNIKALTDSAELSATAEDVEPARIAEEPAVRPAAQTEERPDGDSSAGRKEGRANKPGFQKVTVYIPDELYTRLKVHSVTARIDLYKIAEDAFTRWIEENKGR